MNKLYVGNIPFDVTEQELQDLFCTEGEILSVRVITDKFSGKSKGFGFVEYNDSNSAGNAISKYDGFEMKGRPIRVSEAKAKPEGGGRSGGPRGGGGRGGPRGGGGHRGGNRRSNTH